MMHKQEIEHYLAIGELRQKLGLYFEDFVSHSAKSIPGSGSPTMPLYRLNELEVFKHLTHIVTHKSGGFTIKTSLGNIRFWPSTFKQDYEQALTQGPAIVAAMRQL